jgi:pre-mRNA-splicing factor ATP-dependent RNA helicase DHX15/PRP43
MERCEVELVSLADEGKLFMKIRQVLVCGFFMQVAHKEGEKNNYLTVKDHQVKFLNSLRNKICCVTDDGRFCS